MTSLRRGGGRAPFTAFLAAFLVLLLGSSSVLAGGAEWTGLRRVSDSGGTRLDSLHQLVADRGDLHLVQPRVGPGVSDDRVYYQRSSDGLKWSSERTLFSSTSQRRHVIPNLAIDARANVVAAAWRVNGPGENMLFIRVSRDGGQSFGVRDEIFATKSGKGIGVPAVAVGDDFVAVAWTDRANGKIKLRISRDDGRTFKGTSTLGRTALSIDCRKRISDGLVGMAAAGRWLHVAWSHAPRRSCHADAVKVRSSSNRGKGWSPRRTITRKRNYGWPELDARGKTVMATVQSPTGGVIVARSGRNGRNWRDSMIRAPKGHSFSAADVTLLSKNKALMTYVDERIRKSKLVGTKVVSRRSADDGRRFKALKTVAPSAKRLRMAPNIAATGKRATIVVQSGPLDGSPRNIYASRLD